MGEEDFLCLSLHCYHQNDSVLACEKFDLLRSRKHDCVIILYISQSVPVTSRTRSACVAEMSVTSRLLCIGKENTEELKFEAPYPTPPPKVEVGWGFGYL